MTAKRNGSSTAGRPRLTARSVLASTLLGLDPPELHTSTLVTGAHLLGVTPGTARVAISRMVASGELEAIDGGYRLSGHLLARQARQLESITGAPQAWDGLWRTALVPADTRTAADRSALRRAMTSLRHAGLRDGVWLRPNNLHAATLPEAAAVAERHTLTLLGTPLENPVALAAELWDLTGWDQEAQTLLTELEPLATRLTHDETDALAGSFVAAAAVLRHLQADPLLPPALVPDHWHGDELRAAQRSFEALFRRVLRGWHRSRDVQVQAQRHPDQ